MADQFYTHRLRRLLEDTVIASGITVMLSDESSQVKLKEHISAIQILAKSVNVDVTDQTQDGVTLLRFRRRK